MVDNTLAASFFTAYAPNFGLTDKLKRLADSTIGSAWRSLKSLFCARTAPAFDGVRPSGDVAPAPGGGLRQVGDDRVGGLRADNLQRATTATMRSRETWRDLPQLSVTEARDVERYFHCTALACGPQPGYDDQNVSLQRLRVISPNMRDAFFESVEGRDGIARDVLPSSVLESSLVNAAAGAFQRELGGVTQKPPAPGQLRPEVMTHLSDSRTGFSAGITYDPDRREVVIAFSGLGSSKMTARQALRTAMNWLGFIPKNMSQASKLTRLVKQHIEEVNRSLPEGQKLKLTLTGHSMGGGLASYAALRNQVPGVVTNPMRLGWGARARIGQSRLVEADKYLTEVVVQGDWVADNHAAKLYMPLVPVFNVRGPLGHARRFMVPNYQNRHAHNDISGLLQSMAHQERRLRMARNVLPHLQQTSPRARGDMVAGNVEQALGAALRQGMRDAGLRISNREVRDIARLVQTLVSGSGNREQARTHIEALRNALDSLRARTPPGRNLPPVLLAIARDFVPAPTSRQDQDRVQSRIQGDPKLRRLLG